MKKILCVLLALVAVLSFTACSGDDTVVPDGYKLASNSEACAYSLFVPENFISGDSGSTFTKADVSNSDHCEVSFMITPEIGGNTVAEHWESLQASYAATFPEGYAVTEDEQGTVVSVGGVSGFRYIFTAKYGGKDYKFMQIFVARATVMTAELYVFTYTAAADHYDTHLEAVNGIVSNIVWD